MEPGKICDSNCEFKQAEDESGTYTVSRDKPTDLHAKLIALVRARKPKEEIEATVKKMQNDKANYGGVYHKCFFRVDHPIELTELGFFGPCKEEKAEYSVDVQVFTGRLAWQTLPESHSRPVAEIRAGAVEAKKEEIFYVRFPEPVLIKAGTWYLIDFKLEGPDTFRCADTHSAVTVTANDGTAKAKFEFLGAKQMPCMRFSWA